MSKLIAKRKPAKRGRAAEAHTRRQRAKVSFVILVLLIVLGGGLLVWWLVFYRSPAYKGLRALQDAYRAERPIEARISGLAYAPFANARGAPAVNKETHALAEKLLLEAVSSSPSAESRQALGIYYLTEREYDRAIHEFKTALLLEPQSAALYSDLGAALLEKGRNEKEGYNLESLAQSLSHLNRALAIDPNNREALFNRALLRKQVILTERAEHDWRSYLEKDSNSLWAEEARQYLNTVEKPIIQIGHSPQELVDGFLDAFRARDEARAWALFSPNREQLTADLLEICLKTAPRTADSSSREVFGALAYAGELDRFRGGDRYTSDLARFYLSASRQHLGAAAEARELLRRAQELYMQTQFEGAAALYTRAQRILSEIGDRCEARMATSRLALIYLEMMDTEKSASLFDELAKDCEADGHRWLLGRVLFYQSGVEFNRNEYSKAIKRAEQARAMAEEINDVQGVLSAGSALIEYYRLLGNRPEALEQISLHLPLLKASGSGVMQLARSYGIGAMTFNTFGLYDLALDYQLEALRFASQLGDYSSLSLAYTHLGLMYGKLGDLAQASNNLENAYALGEAHAEEVNGRDRMAYASLHMGNLHREAGNYAEALSKYNRSIELYSSLNFPTVLYQAYKGRLVCYIAQGDITAAQQQIDETLALIDKYRENIFEEDNRNNFFDIEQSVYDLAIGFEHSRMPDGHKALEYAEASRARSLLDSITAGAQVVSRNGQFDLVLQSGARPMPLTEIQASIPEDARLLEYAVLEDKLLVWIISRRQVKSVATKISKAELTDKVLSYLASLKSPSDTSVEVTARLARELYDHLIAPVEPMMGGSHKLHIVPDKVLNHLPWDALISPTRGTLLVEEYLVTTSPSATLFAICTAIAGEKADERNELAMIVGNPSFDRLAFPELDLLLDAESEARKISSLYSSRPLIGPAASEQAVRAEMVRVDVAHFASHCQVNPRSAMQSSLVLAKKPGNGPASAVTDGMLQAHEIYGLKLPRLRLAVLSACETGVERYYRGEGMIGMARAFLVARVPLVVASLWAVDSRATAALMTRFHEYRKVKGMSTADAIWHAKRSLLEGSVERYRQPFYWAAFQVIGGHASF